MTSLFSVKDKTVVITGGSGYLGSEWCRVFEEEGAKVVNWDLDHQVDVTEIIDKIDDVDVLIAGASLGGSISFKDQSKPYELFPDWLWDEEMDVNLRGVQFAMKAVVPSMMERRKGSIVFISSELALVAPDNAIYPPNEYKDIAYITSKAGLLGLMRAWAAYLGHYKIRVNALCPGGIYKDQSPEFVSSYQSLNLLGRMGARDEMNGPLLFLASDASSFMTGATLVVDGGRTAW